jgi:hypothetical protein
MGFLDAVLKRLGLRVPPSTSAPAADPAQLDAPAVVPQPLGAVLDRLGLGQPLPAQLMPDDPSAGLRIAVEGMRAVEVWEHLREAVEESAHWPVLLGGDDELRFLGEIPADEPHEATLALASALDGRSWPAGRAEETRAWLVSHGHEPGDEEEDLPPRGDWPPDIQPCHSFSAPFGRTVNVPLPRVHIGLVPTRHGHEVPAFLRFGGWNACPNPEQHVAVLRSWSERYGAELVSLTHDVIELAVSRPPIDREVALALAMEQYQYCNDIVDQGVGTLEALASGLLGSTVWYFWWD